MERIRRHVIKQCGIKFMRHLWLNFLFVLMVFDLAETLNKEVVMVHCGNLELWVDGVY